MEVIEDVEMLVFAKIALNFNILLKPSCFSVSNKPMVTLSFSTPNSQRKHWKHPINPHKGKCKYIPPEISSGEAWCKEYRLCSDGSFHFGDLELITWETNQFEPALMGITPNGMELIGFGGRSVEDGQAKKLKAKWEDPNVYNQDKEKLFKDYKNAFRWTCCGVNVDVGTYGCDHHGRKEALKHCGCDFCRGGEPNPMKAHKLACDAQAAFGLHILGGPDPRSVSPEGRMNLAMRRAHMSDDNWPGMM